jgi:hypothetical protein
MVKRLFVAAAAAVAMSVPPPRTPRQWGFTPLLTDRRCRRRKRSQSCPRASHERPGHQSALVKLFYIASAQVMCPSKPSDSAIAR